MEKLVQEFELNLLSFNAEIDKYLTAYKSELESKDYSGWNVDGILMSSEHLYNTYHNKMFELVDKLYPRDNEQTITHNGMTYSTPQTLFRFQLHLYISRRRAEFDTIREEFENSLENL